MAKPSLQATLTPAYGRDYKSKKAAITDFREGKDFVYNLMGRTTLISVREYSQGDMVKIRYNGLKHVAFYRVVKEDL